MRVTGAKMALWRRTSGRASGSNSLREPRRSSLSHMAMLIRIPSA